jgi:glycosyltransferase involved in cell wall biosynthesis
MPNNDFRSRPRLELIYPYTPSTIFVPEERVAAFHENSVTKTMREASSSGRWQCQINYLTDNKHYYRGGTDVLPVSFYPVSFRRFPASSRYHHQWSNLYLRHLLADPPDALCVFGSGGHFAQAVAALCKLKQIPYFIIAGDVGIPHSRIQRAFFRNAQRVLVHTQWHLDYLVSEKGIDGLNLEVFPIGIDTRQFAPKPLETYFRAGGFPRLLTIGRLIPSKGVLEAMQAFVQIKRAFPDAHLDVVGPHADLDFLGQLRAFVESRGLQDAVSFPGIIRHDDLPVWYQHTDLMIYPSESESLGMVVLESMSSGTPVIARRGSGGPDEIISHGKDGLVLEPDQMGSAAIELLENRELLAKMGQAARRKIETQYSAIRTKSQLEEILDILGALVNGDGQVPIAQKATMETSR